MDIKNFKSSIAQISEEKGLSPDKVFESIEMAIAAAYKKEYGQKGQLIKAKLDSDTGAIKFWQVKLVVAEDMIYSEEELEKMKQEAEDDKEEKEEDQEKIRFNPERHIILAEAQKINSKIKVDEELEIALDTHEDYGRIAAQTAKQVILQKIKEAERAAVLDEYKSKEGEIVSGIIQQIEPRSIFLDIGKTLGILPKEEQVPGEFYRPGQRLRVYISKVEETSKGPQIFLSRAYPKFISKLFELEVPEVTSGQILIKSIAREAGSRSKISVDSLSDGIDPIGSMVGQRGTRVGAVINELGGEKIDIIEYSDDPEEYIAKALAPAKVTEVEIMLKNRARAIVPEDQLSLAIGKDGQNVRLAAKLTGWKIDVRTADQETEEPKDDEKEEKEITEKPEKKKKKKEPAVKKTAKKEKKTPESK
ncbi:transcription termination/antitermination protein NusA [Candidatus Parcubacteria bacterium]|nr:transcription termination/antitermination protein NusA [Candidatus Parcubacteria bacterium]